MTTLCARLLLLLAVATTASIGTAWGQTPPASAPATAADEAGVRAALQRCVDGWNRHDPKAFGDCLTADAWVSEADDSFYRRFQGRDKGLGLLDYNLRNSDLRWEVLQLRPQPDGTVAVLLRQHVDMLPKTDGKYAMSFESNPSFARLRRDGGGWKLSFLTSHAGWSRALLLALDQPPKAAPKQAPGAALPTVPGTEPAAYTTIYGDGGQSCGYCHGNPPLTATATATRYRIVAVAAATPDVAALRRAMAQPALGGYMIRLLDDPALTDAQLDAIRLWLRAVRDGRAELKADRIVIHNPRSERDPPVRLATLRAEGGWRLPADAGCR
ncbi:MAG: hypothetical protein ABI696_16215, partial [Rubrivivax sp.]